MAYFPSESTCPTDMPDTCWQPWEHPNDPPADSWGEIHEYESIAMYEPTPHPAYFNYIGWFKGGSGNWHRQAGSALVMDHIHSNKKSNGDIRFLSSNISPQSSIDVEGDGIQYVEGLTEGIMRKKDEITLDYIGLEQKTMSTSHLKRVDTIKSLDDTQFIATKSGMDYIINRNGYPESASFDRIIYPKKFNKRRASHIPEFDSAGGLVLIDTEDFGLTKSASFNSVKNESKLKEVSSEEYDFIYNRAKGFLYFNENNTDAGFGDGGIVGIFDGAPKIHPDSVYFM